MKKTLLLRMAGSFCAALVVLAILFSPGCKKNDNPTAPVLDQQISADAADVISDALAANNGGVVDQLNDVMDVATTGMISGSSGMMKTSSEAVFDSVQRIYNPADTSWTIVVARERGNGLTYYGKWFRVLWYQFIGADGKAQQTRGAIGLATATVKHKIVRGSGAFFTPRLSSYLKSISADWVATNTNTDTVSVNGTFARSGIDSSKVRLKRILDHSLALNFSNIKGPRGTRMNYHLKYSGTITGTYTATVTTRDGSTFTYTKNISIIIGGGAASFAIDGVNHKIDLRTGDPM
jgi:hypothetical protein